MRSDVQIDLAWERLRKAEKALDAYLHGWEYDCDQHKQLSHDLIAAIDDLMSKLTSSGLLGTNSHRI